MSHPEQLAFFSAVVRANQELVAGSRILEVGSYDVNGGIRKLFDRSDEYVGVDLSPGPNVDLVAYGHEVDHADGYYDMVISGECFEHDPHWRTTFANMARMTRPGGLVAFTCASRGRPEHGTARSDARLSPGTQSMGLDYYRNLTASDFAAAFELSALFSEHQFWTIPLAFDLYFAGIRSGSSQGGSMAHLPSAAEVREVAKLMPLPHKIARAPLWFASRVVDEPRYQDLALPYWSALIRAQDRIAGGRFRRTPTPVAELGQPGGPGRPSDH